MTAIELEPGIVGPFGKLLLIERLGTGPTGNVYLAKDLELMRLVAVKMLHGRFSRDGGTAARLHAYVRTAKKLRHPHIGRVLESGVVGGTHYVSREWLVGSSLTERVGRPIGPAVAVALLKQLCAALQAGHQHGVVHRGLKPDNIFLTSSPAQDDFVKVLDFGLSSALLKPKPGSPRTPSGQLVGTAQYLAPEQCTGGVVDLRANLYAVGLIAYELVTGRVPFDGKNPIQVMMRQRDERPVPPNVVQASVPQALSDVIMRALEKRPENRFATAAELGDALVRARVAGPPRTATADVKLAGRTIAGATCTQLFSGGLLLATNEELPPIGTALRVTLFIDGVQVECSAEVSTHVGPRQAAAWGTPPGFAARFTKVQPEAQEVIERVLRGDPLPHRAPDPELERLRRALKRRRDRDDFYLLLGVGQGTDAAAIRRRARECRAKVEDALLKPCDAATRTRLQGALVRLDEAVWVLCEPARRIEYDGARGNFRGIAACLDAGLDPKALAACRLRFGPKPAAAAEAAAHSSAAEERRQHGQVKEALTECEKALALDPLSPALHGQRAGLLFLLESQAETLSGEWRLVRGPDDKTPRPSDPPQRVAQRHVMGGTEASVAKTPPSPRSTPQLSPVVEPAGG